jgi:hypothetical protein
MRVQEDDARRRGNGTFGRADAISSAADAFCCAADAICLRGLGSAYGGLDLARVDLRFPAWRPRLTRRRERFASVNMRSNGEDPRLRNPKTRPAVRRLRLIVLRTRASVERLTLVMLRMRFAVLRMRFVALRMRFASGDSDFDPGGRIRTRGCASRGAVGAIRGSANAFHESANAINASASAIRTAENAIERLGCRGIGPVGTKRPHADRIARLSFGRLAQLVRARASHARGRRFESSSAHQTLIHIIALV